MKPFAAAVILLLAQPAVAHAGVSLVARDVPLHGDRALMSTGTPRFDLVGVHWRGTGNVSFRTRSFAGRWSAWHAAAPEAEDGPDRPAQPGWRIGNPYWTGASAAIQYRTRGRVTRLRAFLVWSPVDALPPRRLSIAGSPALITRAGWGADESIRRAPPQFAASVNNAIVHHTAGTNSYSKSQSAAIVRGIEVYHVKGNGWNDIGYNALVDKYGQVFEGRYGGMDKNVVGAHAEGFNTGSFGVAVLGTYGSAAPPAIAQTALASLIAWRLDVAHVDPLSTLMVSSGGNPRFAAGTPVFLRAVSGHRDTGFTTCPGDALYARLAAIASRAASTGLPKLYAPTVRGHLGAPIEFSARLSASGPWTVTVTDANGATVGSGSGSGTAVDWAWDATNAQPGRYAWTISAGSDVRPATGFVGAAPVPLALRGAAVKPGIVSTGQPATIFYTLTAPATVTATLRDATGRQLATLFSDRRSAGARTFTFAADGVADGRYSIVLTATDGTKTVNATLPVTVDRTLSQLAASPGAFSPNGDGRRDALAVRYRLARPAHVRVEMQQASRVVAPLDDTDRAAGAQELQWNGTTAAGPVRDGTYAAVVTATSELGTTTHRVLVRVDTQRPVLRAVSFARRTFRLSEAATVELTWRRKTYRRAFRRGAFTFPLRGAARAYTVHAIDAAGNVSRTLRAR